MNAVYIGLTCFIAVLIAGDICALFSPIYLCYMDVAENSKARAAQDGSGATEDNSGGTEAESFSESVLHNETMKATGLMVAQLGFSVALGYFALIVFFALEPVFQPQPRLPRLEDLPRDLEQGLPDSDDDFSESDVEDVVTNIKSAGKQLKKLEESTNINNITSKLVFEASKLALSVDRMRLCAKFASTLPPRTRVSKSEVNEVLRLFTDVDDGLRILQLFEPHMNDDEESSTARARDRKSKFISDARSKSSKSNKSNKSNKSKKSDKSDKSNKSSKSSKSNKSTTSRKNTSGKERRGSTPNRASRTSKLSRASKDGKPGGKGGKPSSAPTRRHSPRSAAKMKIARGGGKDKNITPKSDNSKKKR